MKNSELLNKIAGNSNNEGSDDKTSLSIASMEKKKFLVFSIGREWYAFAADLIREIIISDEIYFIPFVQPYIRGYINRHGEPYTVIDLKVLFKKETQETNKFLILEKDDDQIAFLVTEVKTIAHILKNDIHEVAIKEAGMDYFSEAITIDNTDIFTIDADSILKKLENDL